jgi:hypothetical protein
LKRAEKQKGPNGRDDTTEESVVLKVEAMDRSSCSISSKEAENSIGYAFMDNQHDLGSILAPGITK